MKILVTGASGLVGKAIQNYITKQQQEQQQQQQHQHQQRQQHQHQQQQQQSIKYNKKFEEYRKFQEGYYKQSHINQTSPFQSRDLYVKTLVQRPIIVPTYFRTILHPNYVWSATC